MPEGDAELQDLYREVLLDYFRSGSHKGRLEPADFHAHGINPVCGDEVDLTIRAKDGKISAVRFTGQGCVISQASTAMMAESLEGVEMGRAKELVAAFKDVMLSKAPEQSLPDELESVHALAGVRKYATRVKCATLAWNTVLQGFGARKSDFQETP